MKSEFESLFSPLQVGECHIKNRIIQTSIAGASIFGWMKRRSFSKEAAEFLQERAKKEVGLIITGVEYLYNPLFGTPLYRGEKKFIKLKDFMENFHKTGAKLFVQVSPSMGRNAPLNNTLSYIYKHEILKKILKPILDLDSICTSSSSNPNVWADGCFSKTMSSDRAKKIIDAYTRSAVLLKESRVDGIEIDALHFGGFLDSFALKYANTRDDIYAREVEDRLSLHTQIIRSIKEACGKNFAVSVRLSAVSHTKSFRRGAVIGEEYIEEGKSIEDSIKMSKILIDAGCDMLNCDSGTYDAIYWAHPPIYMKDNCNLEDVAKLKKEVSVPVVCSGKMDVDTASKAITEGLIDAAGFGRNFLVDPNWIVKIQADTPEEIKPCINCHIGCFRCSKVDQSPNLKSVSDLKKVGHCAINPLTMQKNKYKYKPIKNVKKIAIVGGGISGMEAALLLKKRGHVPVIYEKESELGGICADFSKMSFKNRERQLLDWYRNQIAQQEIEVRKNVLIDDVSLFKEDEVILATGSVAKRSVIPELESMTISARDYLKYDIELGKNVVILGGGHTGVEIAYELAFKGIIATIIEEKSTILSDSNIPYPNASFLKDSLSSFKIPVHLSAHIVEVKDNVIKIVSAGSKKRFIDVDTLIDCSGNIIPKDIKIKGRKVYRIGNCKKIGDIQKAIYDAWDVASKI